MLQEFVIKKILRRRKSAPVVKGEVRIMIIIAYGTMLAVVGLVVYVYLTENISFQQDIAKHILCESTGTSPDCSLDESITNTLSSMFSSVRVMAALVPLMVLIVNFNLKITFKIGTVTGTGTSK